MVLSKIQELCSSKGITISKLEKDLSLGNGTIHKWNKSNPSIDRLRLVGDYFGVSLDYIIGRNNQSADSQIIAGIFNALPIEKQNLIKQYISVIQQK